MKNTKIMSQNSENQIVQIELEGTNMELVDKYVQLEQVITVDEYMQTADLNRRNRSTWSA